MTLPTRLSLPGKTILITGAARGIGEQTARRLLAAGANVSLVGLEPERLRALAAELGPRAAWFDADVTDQAAIDAAVAGTVERFGGIDVVIANAGIAPPTTTVDAIDADAFARTLAVNINGVWRTVKAALPHIIAGKGHVVLISSIYSFLNGSLNASYAMSKAAVEQLGRALRVELAPHGATAGVAYFGFVETDMVSTAFAQEAADALRKALPAFITAPIPLERAVSKLVNGVQRRSPRVIAPGWVAPALALRGPLALIDGRLAGDSRVRAAIGIAERK